MPHRYLPIFAFDSAVIPDMARQDKVEIEINLGSVSGINFHETAEDVAMFLNYLGAPPAEQPGDEAFGRIFVRRRNGVSPFREQPIRSNSSSSVPAPLFAGKLIVRNPSHGGPSVWSFSVLLSLNPTRFLRHQRFTLSQLRTEDPTFNYELYRVSPLRRCDDEFALIDRDNWLPDEQRWHRFTTPRLWRRHLEYYLSAVVEEIREDIERAAAHAQICLISPSTNPFTLTSVEHYWEFSSEDPLGAVTAIEPLLATYSANCVDPVDYPLDIPEENGAHNSRRLRIQTRVGEALVIYSKTNRRIRFDVRHSLRGAQGFRGLPNGHTALTVEGLLPMIEHLGGVSATRLNGLLNHFRLHASTPGEQKSVLSFICDFQAAFAEPERALSLLRILVANGSLVVGRNNELRSAYERELRRLSRRGREVLCYSNGRYTVSPLYRQALEMMQQGNMGFILGSRIRRRIAE